MKSHAAAIGGFTHGESAAAGALPTLFLADQVEMGRAFLALAQAGAEPAWIARAEAVGQFLLDRFEDRKEGGFFANTVEEHAVGVFGERRKPFEGNARAARFLLRLHQQTGEGLWKDSAQRALRWFADEAALREEGRSVGDYVLALEELAHPPVFLHVSGRPGAKDTNTLYAAALEVYAPGRIVKLSPPGEEYPDIGKAAIYVCGDRTCSPPVTDPARLADEVAAALNGGR